MMVGNDLAVLQFVDLSQVLISSICDRDNGPTRDYLPTSRVVTHQFHA